MLFVLIAAAFLTYSLYSFYSNVKRLPPGPLPLPFIGNLIQFGWGIYKHGGVIPMMHEWHKKYGPVMTWYLGPMVTVNIADYDIAVEAMVKKGAAFANRNDMPPMSAVRNGRGIIVSNGEHWQEQRRFALHTLRNFGLGRNLMQDRIMSEFKHRTELLDEEIKGGAHSFDPSTFIVKTVGNIVNRILFSEGFTEETEERFFEMKSGVDRVFEDTNLSDFFAFVLPSWLPFVKNSLKKFTEPQQAVISFIREQIEQRKLEIDSGKHVLEDEGHDFVDAFLMEMKKKDVGDSFNDETLPITVFDLWTAGQETTTTTLYWALNYLLLHPEVKNRIYEEVRLVTGRKSGNDRSLQLSDRTKTMYLNATILEILRVSSLIPLNLGREAIEDTEVGGYLIPKGTPITAQLSLIVSDPKLFPESEKFNPDRFLQGNNSEQFVVSFGLGKRACLGESLARAELYLILGNLLLNYRIETDPEHPPQMRATKEVGGMRKPNPYHIVISKRT